MKAATVADTCTLNEQLPPLVAPPGICDPETTTVLVAPAMPVIVALAGRVALAPSKTGRRQRWRGVDRAMPGEGVRQRLRQVYRCLVGVVDRDGQYRCAGWVAVVGLNDLVTVGGSGGATRLPASPTAVPLWTGVLLTVRGRSVVCDPVSLNGRCGAANVYASGERITATAAMPYAADRARDRGGLHHLGTVDGVTGVVERQLQEAHRVGVRDQPEGAGLLVRKNVAAGIDERVGRRKPVPVVWYTVVHDTARALRVEQTDVDQRAGRGGRTVDRMFVAELRCQDEHRRLEVSRSSVAPTKNWMVLVAVVPLVCIARERRRRLDDGAAGHLRKGDAARGIAERRLVHAGTGSADLAGKVKRAIALENPTGRWAPPPASRRLSPSCWRWRSSS